MMIPLAVLTAAVSWSFLKVGVIFYQAILPQEASVLGREREHRQRLKYLVESVKKKTMDNQIQVELRENLGLSEAEAELLSGRISEFLWAHDEVRNHNQILIRGTKSRKQFIRKKTKTNTKKVTTTPLHHEDLELELEFGLKAMQKNRLLRLTEEAWSQDSLLAEKELSLILNITANSLRSRIKEMQENGIRLLTSGLSRNQRQQVKNHISRSTWFLKHYFTGKDPVVAREMAAISQSRKQQTLTRFSALIEELEYGEFGGNDLEEREWVDLVNTLPKKQLEAFQEEYPALSTTKPFHLRKQLEKDFGYSPVLIRAIYEFVKELKYKLQDKRKPGQIVYWAVDSSEPAGKPLSACKLVAVPLTLLSDEDREQAQKQSELKRLSGIKLQKMIRYATEAKACGAYINYADLSYITGMHTSALRRLVSNNNVVLPLRGVECDIGRGTSHREEIIELYLQMHTETEIVNRTGHSYSAIENYIKEFATVFVLSERGLGAAMIRKITRRSMKLIRTYLRLTEKYSSPEYAFRFQQLRRLFRRAEDAGEKRGL